MSGVLYEALYYDGESADAEQVSLSIDTDEGTLTGGLVSWPIRDIRALPDGNHGRQVVLRLIGNPVARLVMADRDVLQHLPHWKKPEPVQNLGRIFKWAAGAVTSVAMIVFVLVPVMADQLAGFIPPKGERALGEVTLDQIRGALSQNEIVSVNFCESNDGLAALDKIQQRLSASREGETELSVHVLDHPMVNAFALPGGYIVFFRGLIEAAGSAEEVAAVFAHEMGHVVSRDPTRNALRSAGSIGVLGLLFGDFAGGAAVLFLSNQLINAQYSQKAEESADIFAHALMQRADLAPSALADMFERFQNLGPEPEGIVAHFLSHPALGNRIEAARDATPTGFRPAPLLTVAEWTALKNICD